MAERYKKYQRSKEEVGPELPFRSALMDVGYDDDAATSFGRTAATMDSKGYDTFIGPIAGKRTRAEAIRSGKEDSLHRSGKAVDLRDRTLRWEKGTKGANDYAALLGKAAKDEGLGWGGDYFRKGGEFQEFAPGIGWDPHHIQIGETAISVNKLSRMADAARKSGSNKLASRIDDVLFKNWWKTNPEVTAWREAFLAKYGEEPRMDDPNYDYREAWRSGITPKDVPYDDVPHWSSAFKGDNHPTRYIKTKDGMILDSKNNKLIPNTPPGVKAAEEEKPPRPPTQTETIISKVLGKSGEMASQVSGMRAQETVRPTQAQTKWGGP